MLIGKNGGVRGAPLEPDPELAGAWLAEASRFVVEFLERLPDLPASDTTQIAPFLADADLRMPPPEHGRALGELLEVVDRATTKGLNTASPGYLAFIPGSGLVSAAIADLVGDVLNRYTGLAFPAPGFVALEADVLRWMADLFGLPAEAAGILTTGGSLATFSAVLAAKAALLPENFLHGTIYLTAHTHQAVAKAMRLAGFPGRAVRVVPVDADLRIDLAALRDMVMADRAAGSAPFCVVGNAGSTDTGTVDDLPALADLAREEGLWFHVDAAYGGFFQLTERGRRRLVGVERADSLVLDPHKGLFLPFGTGALLVRDGDQLKRAHSGGAGHYLQDIGELDLPNFGDYSPELTRDSRGLRVWLPLHLHGLAVFRAALDDKLDLAQIVHAALAADEHLEVPWSPDLSTVVFRCRDDRRTAAELDIATMKLMDRVNAERRVRLSSTRIGERQFVRVSVLNHRTDSARIAEAIAAIRGHAAAP